MPIPFFDRSGYPGSRDLKFLRRPVLTRMPRGVGGAGQLCWLLLPRCLYKVKGKCAPVAGPDPVRAVTVLSVGILNVAAGAWLLSRVGVVGGEVA